MLEALAPRLPRGCSWVLLASLGLAAPASAQDDAAKKAAPPVATSKPGDEPAKQGPTDAEEAKESDEERFLDPNAKATLQVFNPVPYRGRTIKTKGTGNDLTRLQNMASGLENPDPELIKAYIDFFATELTRRDYINAIVKPEGLSPTAPAARGIEAAVDALTRPIIDGRANEAQNKGFVGAYARALFESQLPKLLDNNYFTRVNAMIVLGMAGGTTNQALDLYAAQLRAADQLIWVKMWAARGYTNATQSGTRFVEVSKAVAGAEALVEFLQSSPNLPYFAKFRALEALGSLRIATATRPDLKLDAASVAAQVLVDPEARFPSRAWAAWALGMMRVAPQVTPYNYALAGSEVGGLAVTLANTIVAEFDEHAAKFDDNKDRSANLTALLMFQVVPALSGEEAISDSGLLRATHPSAGAAKPFLGKVDERVKAIARATLAMLNAPPGDRKARRDELKAKADDLKAFLDQNKPRDRRLVPGGPALPAAAVAGPAA